MIARPAVLKAVRDSLKANPVVALLGPRQCGKTTLAGGLAETVTTSYFDLENPADLARLAEPMLALERVKGLVVIDEVQRRPDLFPVLRVLADRRAAPARPDADPIRHHRAAARCRDSSSAALPCRRGTAAADTPSFPAD